MQGQGGYRSSASAWGHISLLPSFRRRQQGCTRARRGTRPGTGLIARYHPAAMPTRLAGLAGSWPAWYLHRVKPGQRPKIRPGFHCTAQE